MKSFSVICGLPRSGSTLLCNLLNQHPDIYCSDTSPLVSGLSAMISTISNSEETKAMLLADRKEAEISMSEAVRGAVMGWYTGMNETHVFDKGRGWNYNMRMLMHITSQPLGLVLVRDPRDVVASIHKNADRFPLYDQALDPLGKTLHVRTEELMSAQGMVGSCIIGVSDLLRRKEGAALFVKYEDFVRDPVKVLDRVLSLLHVVPVEWNIEDVQNRSKEADGLYLNKFPHEGSGEVTDRHIGTWREVLDQELAEEIRAAYPFYCRHFGY